VGLAFTIIAAILAAFLYRIATEGHVQPWLVLLVSVLGLAAGAAVLGTDAFEASYEAYRELRR
jgi:uncharacterized membrane protein YfcA